MMSVTFRKELPRKYANVFTVAQFIELQSYCEHIATPSQTVIETEVLSLGASDQEIGETLSMHLEQSRLLSLEESEEVALDWASYYHVRVGSRAQRLGYRDRYEFFQNMRSCFITSCDGKIIIIPQYHIELARWTHEGGYGITHFVFPENTPPAELGAGLRLAFNSCGSKGDFDPNDLPVEKGRDSRVLSSVFTDIRGNYPYINFYFETEDKNFMDICISDDRELVFMFFQSPHEFQLNLIEWDQIQLEAEVFFASTLYNDNFSQKLRRQYKEYERE